MIACLVLRLPYTLDLFRLSAFGKPCTSYRFPRISRFLPRSANFYCFVFRMFQFQFSSCLHVRVKLEKNAETRDWQCVIFVFTAECDTAENGLGKVIAKNSVSFGSSESDTVISRNTNIIYTQQESEIELDHERTHSITLSFSHTHTSTFSIFLSTSSVQQSICHALFCFSYFPLCTC